MSGGPAEGGHEGLPSQAEDLRLAVVGGAQDDEGSPPVPWLEGAIGRAIRGLAPVGVDVGCHDGEQVPGARGGRLAWKGAVQIASEGLAQRSFVRGVGGARMSRTPLRSLREGPVPGFP